MDGCVLAIDGLAVRVRQPSRAKSRIPRLGVFAREVLP
jgi:hypothetical protein